MASRTLRRTDTELGVRNGSPWDDIFCQEKPAQVSPEEAAAKPIWDETAGCFWCPTGVNAYDIPEALEWQQEFREAVLFHEPDFFSNSSEFQLKELTNMPSIFLPSAQKTTKVPSYEESAGGRRASARSPSPATPTRKRAPGWTPSSPKTPPQRGRVLHSPGLSSPKTPPLYRAVSPRTRGLRATHTKALQTLKQKSGLTAVVQGREIAFFRFGGEVFAVGARCPHQGGNLSEGEVGDIEDLLGTGSKDGKRPYVTCPVHKMQFDLRDGSVIDGHCSPMKTYKVRITEADEVGKVAPILVAFDSLAEGYFVELLF